MLLSFLLAQRVGPFIFLKYFLKAATFPSNDSFSFVLCFLIFILFILFLFLIRRIRTYILIINNSRNTKHHISFLNLTRIHSDNCPFKIIFTLVFYIIYPVKKIPFCSWLAKSFYVFIATIFIISWYWLLSNTFFLHVVLIYSPPGNVELCTDRNSHTELPFYSSTDQLIYDDYLLIVRFSFLAWNFIFLYCVPPVFIFNQGNKNKSDDFSFIYFLGNFYKL